MKSAKRGTDMRKVHVSAGLFSAGLVLLIGKAGASDIGTPLVEAVPGVLLGVGVMVAGAYGLWLADIKKEPPRTRRSGK